MHLVVLMTNTDESDFAQRHPKDGEKFTRLIHSVRPDWKVTSFNVKDGVFPRDVTIFDGIIITGSPASVLDSNPWVARLLNDIRTAYRAHTPMFGACFGHQAIALALGGKVEQNDSGWGFGLVEMTVADDAPWLSGNEKILQYAAHIEHVTQMPEGARNLFVADHCEVSGFAMGDLVYTTQNHPEMTSDFIAALVEEYADKMPGDVIERARISLNQAADTKKFAETIAVFFELAAKSSKANS